MSPVSATWRSRLGPASRFFDDDEVVEVLVHPEGDVLARTHDGGLRHEASVMPPRTVHELARAIAGSQRVDGMEVRVVASEAGPYVRFLRRAPEAETLEGLEQARALHGGMRFYLERAIDAALSVVVFGADDRALARVQAALAGRAARALRVAWLGSTPPVRGPTTLGLPAGAVVDARRLGAEVLVVESPRPEAWLPLLTTGAALLATLEARTLEVAVARVRAQLAVSLPGADVRLLDDLILQSIDLWIAVDAEDDDLPRIAALSELTRAAAGLDARPLVTVKKGELEARTVGSRFAVRLGEPEDDAPDEAAFALAAKSGLRRRSEPPAAPKGPTVTGPLGPAELAMLTPEQLVSVSYLVEASGLGVSETASLDASGGFVLGAEEEDSEVESDDEAAFELETAALPAEPDPVEDELAEPDEISRDVDLPGRRRPPERSATEVLPGERFSRPPSLSTARREVMTRREASSNPSARLASTHQSLEVMSETDDAAEAPFTRPPRLAPSRPPSPVPPVQRLETLDEGESTLLLKDGESLAEDEADGKEPPDDKGPRRRMRPKRSVTRRS